MSSTADVYASLQNIGNRFSADSSKVLCFRLTDQAFVEPSSIRLQMTIQNLTEDGGGGGLALTPIAPPLAMFARARLCMASQLVEEWVELGPTSVLMDRMKPCSEG